MEALLMSNLFVIEAPGKIKSLEKILKSIDIDAIVVATKGHIFSFPEQLDNLGINSKLEEVDRYCTNESGVKFMRDRAKNCENIYIATDADSEGEVIAWDIYNVLIDLKKDIFRLKLKGMDKESIQEALNDITPIRKEDAIPGRTRAIVDRTIGHTFSKKGIGVGRVLTGLLGIVNSGDLSTKRVRLVAPAKDGNRPWVAYFDVNKIVNETTAEQLSVLAFPAISMKSSQDITPDVKHMGEIMIQAGDELYMTPKESAKSLQNNYETGQMSYPRSGSKGVSRAAKRRLERMLKKSGYKTKAESISEKEENEVHDAPYPFYDVDVSKDPKKLGDDEGIKNLVARNFVKSGQKHKKEFAHTKTIYDFLRKEGFSESISKFISELIWTREIGPSHPGQTSWPKSEIQERLPETVILEKAVELNLGRPSTWANHIESFLDKGLVDDNLHLTSKGQEWVNASPKELLDPRLSAAIEGACEKITNNILNDDTKEPWEKLSEKIVNALPSSIRSEITKTLNDTPKPDQSPYVKAIETIDPLEPNPENTENANNILRPDRLD
jgi:DNA topoisomerase-1